MDGADALRVPESPRPGDEVGSYRLLEELGAGGMGRVFLAEHARLGRRVALKILQPELWHNRRSVQRFFQEAKLVNRIDHANIVEIYDYVQESDGLSYLIMELLTGRDLTQSRELDGVFTLGRTLRIGRQIASALAAAHAQGVVHRDLKPGNVFVVQKGEKRDFVKLLDFGIAKLQDDVDADAPHTRTGSIVGTPLYMSPEQASGEKVDQRSDLYSLGVVLYWMLADAFPFKAKSFAELLVKQQSQQPSDLPRNGAAGEPLPPNLAELIGRCLERDRSRRCQSAGEIVAALSALLGDLPPLGEVQPFGPNPPNLDRRPAQQTRAERRAGARDIERALLNGPPDVGRGLPSPLGAVDRSRRPGSRRPTLLFSVLAAGGIGALGLLGYFLWPALAEVPTPEPPAAAPALSVPSAPAVAPATPLEHNAPPPAAFRPTVAEPATVRSHSRPKPNPAAVKAAKRVPPAGPSDDDVVDPFAH